MASATVGILRVLLTANTAEFDAAMKKASDTAKVWSKDLGQIGQQATAIGSTLTKAITVPLLGLSGAAIKMAMDFESSFAGVRKTVDATEPEFAQLAQGLRNMAKEIPINVNELNRVAEAAGQLGIKKEDILQFTRTMADLGVTTNLTADEAATATAQIQNIFGAAGKDVDRFGATLVGLGNAGASTEKDIINMGLRIAGAGRQVGLTQGQVLAFASTLSSVGINAEAGGSAISRVFLKINDAVAVGGSGMQEFARVAGMSGAQFKQAWETDAAGATTAFIAGLGRLKGEGENVNATIEGLVGKNIILKDTLMRTAGAGTMLAENLSLQARLWADNSALTDEARKRYGTFESQVKLLWAQLRDVGIVLGSTLIPILRDLMTAMQPVIKLAGTAAELFGQLPAPIRLTVVGFLGLAAAIGPVLWAFGQVATGVSTLIGAFTAKGLAMRAITASWGVLAPVLTSAGAIATATGALFVVLGAALVGVGKAIVDLYNHWQAGGSMWAFFSARDDDNFVRRWLGLSDGLNKTSDALDNLSNKGGPALGFTQDLGRAIAEMNTGTADAPPRLRATADGVGELGKKAKDATKDYREFMNWIGERQMEAAAIGIEAMDKLAASLQKNIAVLTPFKAAVQSTGESIKALGGSINDLVSTSLSEYGEASTKARKEAEEWALKNGAVLAPSIRQVTAASLVAATETVSAWQKAMADLPTVILGAIQGGGSVIAAAGSHIGTALMTKFQTTFGPAIEAALPFGIGKAITALLPSLGAMFGPIAKKLGDLFRNIFGGPSGEELAQRGQVAEFEASLHGALTAQQELESQGEDWRRTVIAIRDAYIAAGRSEEEALRDAERLWQSSREGGEDALAVIEEIRRKMQELSQGTTIPIEIEYRTSAPPGATRPDLNDPDLNHTFDPGFAGGTMGRFGSWFKNFGAGMPTSLHGIEAVLRPGDAVPFALDALGGQQLATAGGGTSEVRNNWFLLQVPSDSVGDTNKMASAIFAQVPAALEIDRGDMTTAIEHLVHNVIRTYYTRG